jgi:uncharacterized coiled-coil protein SlyX
MSTAESWLLKSELEASIAHEERMLQAMKSKVVKRENTISSLKEELKEVTTSIEKLY